MTIFEFYGIPETLLPDAAIVRQKYLELSRSFHPDINPDATDDLMALSALNNEAYKVFTDFDKLLYYVLQDRDLVQEGEKQTLPPDFLMEMMDLNEAIQEAAPEALPALKAQIDGLLADMKGEMMTVAALFEKSGEVAKQEQALVLKDLYHKNKYLLRLKESIDKFAAL